MTSDTSENRTVDPIVSLPGGKENIAAVTSCMTRLRTVVRSDSGDIYMPVAGTVTSIAETRHAVNILSDDGVNYLVHVGIDTVAMNGGGFTVLASVGDRVERDTPLMTADPEKIRAAGLSTVVVPVRMR